MTNTYVVIDVEATGNINVPHTRIIEIGLIIIENDRPVFEYSTLINPQTKIPSFITSLTNISNSDVLDAPNFEDIAYDLKEMISHHDIVGHNVLFDLRFLNKQFNLLNMNPLTNKVIDTVELSRILYPGLSQYKLNALATHFNIAHNDPHRALSDTYVTSELFLLLKEKLKYLPFETVAHLKRMQETFHSYLPSLFKQMNHQSYNKSTHKLVNDIVLKNVFNHDHDTRKPNNKVSFGHLVDELYANDGLLAKQFHHYENRSEQQEISEVIYDLFSHGEHGLIEADAGTGKTLAYLIPALYEAVINEERIVISTETLHLQAQIVGEDLEKLKRALPFDFSYTVLKGKRHYLNLNKFTDTLYKNSENYNDTLVKAMILVWLTETETGDLNELSCKEHYRHLVERLSAQTETGSELLSYYKNAYNKAEHSHLIIVNHALLSSDLYLENKLIPHFNKLIVDEAHHFVDIAENQFSLLINFNDTIKTLHKFNKHKKTLKISDLIYELKEFRQFIRPVDFSKTHAQLKINDGFTKEIMTEMLHRIVYSFGQLIKEVEADHVFYSRIVLVKNNFERFYLALKNEELFVSIESRKEDTYENIYLHVRDVNVADLLNEKLYNEKLAVIMTSATLTSQGSFSYIEQELGIRHLNVLKQQFSAPFNLQEQAKIMVPNDFPSVYDEEFIYVATEAIYSLITLLDGKTLVLFTSQAMLKSVYYLLDELIGLQYNLIAQHITHTNNTELINTFKMTDSCVLLATNAMWEGVDLTDDLLQCLIVVKLPFDHIKDIRTRIKQEILHDKHLNSFYTYTLPRMIIRLKQGFGRLIRSSRDKGVIFMLDNRFNDSSYNEHIHATFKEYSIKTDSTKNLIDKTGKWLL